VRENRWITVDDIAEALNITQWFSIFHLGVRGRFSSDECHWRGARSGGIKKKKTCETLEPVRWSRGGLRWKVIPVSLLYIYNKCTFKKKSRYFLTYMFWQSWISHCSWTSVKPSVVLLSIHHWIFCFTLYLLSSFIHWLINQPFIETLVRVSYQQDWISPPCNGIVKNEWSYTSTLLYVLMTRFLIIVPFTGNNCRLSRQGFSVHLVGPQFVSCKF
jgi:hypothetical protein